MNLFRQFRKLLPADPLLVGTVTAHNADGTSDVQLPGNQTIRVRGQGVAVGVRAFVQGGEIRGAAPALPLSTVEV
jgi:hypothetical protein